MNYSAENLKKSFLIPHSLLGRTLLVWGLCALMHLILTTCLGLIGFVMNVARIFGQGHALNFEDSKNWAMALGRFFSGTLHSFASTISVFVTIAAVWLVAYSFLRFVRQGEPSAGRYLFVTCASLCLFYLFRFPFTLWELLMNPEVVKYFSWGDFLFLGNANILMLIVALWASFALFRKIPFADSLSWRDEMTRAEFFSVLADFFRKSKCAKLALTIFICAFVFAQCRFSILVFLAV